MRQLLVSSRQCCLILLAALASLSGSACSSKDSGLSSLQRNINKGATSVLKKTDSIFGQLFGSSGKSKKKSSSKPAKRSSSGGSAASGEISGSAGGGQAAQ